MIMNKCIFFSSNMEFVLSPNFYLSRNIAFYAGLVSHNKRPAMLHMKHGTWNTGTGTHHKTRNKSDPQLSDNYCGDPSILDY